MLRTGSFALIVMVAGIHHTFLAPSICAAVALSVVATQEEMLSIVGAWLIGIFFSAFIRGK